MSISAAPSALPVMQRRHDLDALRAFAMLLGIALHATMSFTGSGQVKDVRLSPALVTLSSATHGFRLQLFFLVSGFFTMMLWRRRGLLGLVKQRAGRILLPCFLAVLVLYPANIAVYGWAARVARRPRAVAAAPVAATQPKDLKRIVAWDGEQASRGAGWANPKPSSIQPQTTQAHSGSTALEFRFKGNGTWLGAGWNWCAFQAGPYGTDIADMTALSFWIKGNGTIADVQLNLLCNGEKRDLPGSSTARVSVWNYCTQLDDGQWHEVVIPLADLVQGQGFDPRHVTELQIFNAGDGDGTFFIDDISFDNRQGLVPAPPRPATPPPMVASGDQPALLKAAMGLRGDYRKLLASPALNIKDAPWWCANLFFSTTFGHLWFLWFLCWMTLAFMVVAEMARLCRLPRVPRWLIVSPACALWVLPLTLVPQWFFPDWNFGPDTSMGILPLPHLLMYYSVFFAFGALYYDCDDAAGAVGRWWWLLLPVALLLIHPFALERMNNWPVTSIVQVVYAWTMCFGMMGLFRAALKREYYAVRYMSDASYWLYIAHVPLVVAGSILVRNWRVPALAKFLLICVVVTGVLLVVYDLCIRYTFIGAMLNGRKKRRQSQRNPVVAAVQ